MEGRNMKVTQYGSNQTIIRWMVDAQPIELFFSYSTCVAGRAGALVFKTDEFHSTTTSKHINAYLRNEHGVDNVKKVATIDQNLLNKISNVNSDPTKAYVLLVNNATDVA